MEQFRQQEFLIADLAENGSKIIRESHGDYLEKTSGGKWCGCFWGMVVVGYYGQAAKAYKKIIEFEQQTDNFRSGAVIAEELQIPLGLIEKTELLHLNLLPAIDIIAKLRAGELEYTP
ncbi:MAG: hypothetical protein Q8R39_03850 [bacterium]|nr:hypothetical protein [bacterium]MDZ4284413.1 hypothetical protein [Patescibacteria group bacterium]